MSITTILIILAVLVLLFFLIRNSKKNSAKSDQNEGKGTLSGTNEATTNSNDIPGEVLTAIFMAMHEEQEVVHDVENTVLTLEPVVRNYSPWNSKIYGLRELPRR